MLLFIPRSLGIIRFVPLASLWALLYLVVFACPSYSSLPHAQAMHTPGHTCAHTHTHHVSLQNVHKFRKSDSLVKRRTFDVKCQYISPEVPVTVVPSAGTEQRTLWSPAWTPETLTSHPATWLDSRYAKISLQIAFYAGIMFKKLNIF